MTSICEQFSTPVVANYDVVVVGGGVAGVAAALAAKRHGATALLIEKQTVLGGLATAGHIVLYLPICDGLGNKVIGGISEELLWESIRYGGGNVDPAWHDRPWHADTDKRYETQFNAGEFAFRMEEMLREAGVHILYDTAFVTTANDGRRVDAVIVENKSGRQAYRCKAVIDASGDGDVFARAGADYGEQDNFLTYWSYYVDNEGGLKLLTMGTNTGEGLPEGTPKFFGTDAEQVSAFLQASHALAFDKIKYNNDNGKQLASFPSMPQLRTTRRLGSAYDLPCTDKFKYQEDSIGCTGDWRKREDVYEIPYRSLYSPKLDNLYAAGRNIGVADSEVWEVTRVIPPAAATGQAAGTAAAQLVQTGATAQTLSVKDLQNTLEQDGILLHYTKPQK